MFRFHDRMTQVHVAVKAFAPTLVRAQYQYIIHNDGKMLKQNSISFFNQFLAKKKTKKNWTLFHFVLFLLCFQFYVRDINFNVLTLML